MGVRVPAPRRVFLPWVAGQRCWSSCYCSWQPLPRRPQQRPILPATRLVIQRAGAGTSDRERGPRGVGAGDDGSVFRPPPTVTELGPAGRAKTNTELVSGRGVSSRSGGDPVSGSDTPPKACANCVLSVKTVTRSVHSFSSDLELHYAMCSDSLIVKELPSVANLTSQHISLIHSESFHITAKSCNIM